MNLFREKDPIQYVLNGLLSNREIVIANTIESLITFATSSEHLVLLPSLFTRLLCIIACGRGLAPRLVSTSIWPLVIQSLLENAPLYSDAVECRRAVVSATVADLTVAGQITSAALLAGRYVMSGRESVLGLSAHIGILRRLLGMGGSTGSGIAAVSVHGRRNADETLSVASQENIEALILSRIMTLLPDIKERSGEALGLLNART